MSGGERVSWPWTALGLSGPAALPEIRRAYAQKLKTTHPEEDPEGFQRLHQAYLTACRQARRAARPALEPEADPRPEPEFGAGFSAREDDQLFYCIYGIIFSWPI